jgi:peptidoglycan/LPS O-acetylase OafA/YrhL
MVMNEKYNWINALRGYAILLVILIHSSQAIKVSDFSKIICNTGDLGVQLFFILSSFTLFNSYSKRRLQEGQDVNRNFFMRRFFRIAPYYYIGGLIYVFYYFFVKNNIINGYNLIANFTFTNGIYLPGINDIPPGGWSIGVEMLFYLLIPILFKYIDSFGKSILLFVLTMLFSIMINHYLLSYTTLFLNLIWGEINPWSLYFCLPNQLPIFILGIILYYINKNMVFSFKLGQMVLILSIMLFISFSFFKFSLVYPFYFIKREYAYGLIFVLFAIGTYTTENKIIINSFVQEIGIVSFSMYLNHFLIVIVLGFIYNGMCKIFVDYLYLSNVILQNDFIFWSFYFLIVILTYFISKKTYKYVEIKGIGLGNKLINKWTENK